jgi:hypothetical protein
MLLLGGCATLDSAPASIDDGGARALAEGGDYAGAARAYEQLARGNRRARDTLLLKAAEAWRDEGDLGALARVLDEVRRKRLTSAEAAHLDLLLAESALAQGDAQRALDLATLPEGSLDRAYRLRVPEIRARALLATGRPIDSARERALLDLKLTGADRAANEQDLLDALVSADVATLNAALGALAPDDPLRPWLERALRLKGAVPARVILRPTRQAGALFADADGSRQREGYASTAQVALLLPLSGPLASAGSAIRDGFLAAFFADTDLEARPRVRILDTGETVEGALAAYQLAVGEGATRVVGPLAREQVAAVQAAQTVTVPVLALNHPDSGAIPPRGSQQFGLLPDEEAAIAADAAIARGLRRAALLGATEDWSERALLAFRAQFEQGGGFITGEARLAPEAVDFGGPIAQATIDAPDVIFLAVRPPQGRLLVPQLRTRGLDALPMLATSHIFSGSVSRALDRDLNGVEFCDAPWLFDLAAGLPARESLARRLPAAAHSPRLFAFGMDAYRILPYLDWLAGNTDAYLPGAIGQLAVDGFGRVRRLPVWLRFDDGVPRPADGALSAFAPTP